MAHPQPAERPSTAGGSVLLRPSARPITRRVVSDRDHPQSTQSLPSTGTITPNLWNAVRQRVRVASALKSETKMAQRRSRAFEDARRFDDEGITSDTIRGDVGHLLAPGQYAEQWQSLAHLFDAADDTDQAPRSRSRSRLKRRSKRFSVAPSGASGSSLIYAPAADASYDSQAVRLRRSASTVQEREDENPDDSMASLVRTPSLKGNSSIKLRSRTSQTASVAASPAVEDLFPHRVSISEEPASMLANDPDQTPLGEDPLLYSSEHLLLETDSESESESGSDSDSDSDANRVDARARQPASTLAPGNGSRGTASEQDSTSRASGNIATPLKTACSSLHGWIKGNNVPLLHKSIVKCALAYLIASLFTYSPALSRWLASFLPNNDPEDDVPFSNLHMIATVAVYFHPAKTLGAMVEADIFAVGAFVYAVTLGFCSMAVAVFLHETNRLLISDIVSVLFFLGLGMALVGYAKIKVAKPQFNTACSLISIIVFTVVVKEGSLHLGHFSTEKTWQYVEATDSLNRLAQHLTGLRSSCGLQHQIMAVRKEAQRLARDQEDLASAAATQPGEAPSQPKSRPASSRLADLFEVDADSDAEHPSGEGGEEAAAMHRTADSATAFEDFIQSVGPHMRSLVFSCGRTLKGLRSTFVAREPPSADAKTLQQEASSYSAIHGGTGTWHDFGTSSGTYVPGTSFDGLQTDISNALRRFQHEQTVAIKRIYTMEPKRLAEAVDASGEVASDPSARHANGGVSSLLQKTSGDEDVFLIFFFVFNLEEFAKELEVLIEALEQIRQAEERIALARQTSVWMRMRLFLATLGTMASEYANMLGWRWGETKRRRSHRARAGGVAKKMTTPLDFPSNRRHARNTDQTPKALTWKEKMNRVVWSLGEFFRQPDTKFAIKAGVGSALLASPAFFPSTRPMFTKFQGQWALVSFMVVLSPTVGQSNHMSIHRILGTLLGACAAVGVYKLFPDNNVVLPLFGVVFSVPCFRYIVGKPQLASSGRFVLLTYNLTALYSYNLRKTDVEVEQIAYQRFASVVVGVVWATVLNQLVWPFEARRQLALGVSDVLFKLAWLYQRLVLSYSRDPSQLGARGSAGSDDEDGAREREEGEDEDEEAALLDEARAATQGAVPRGDVSFDAELLPEYPGQAAQHAVRDDAAGLVPARSARLCDSGQRGAARDGGQRAALLLHARLCVSSQESRSALLPTGGGVSGAAAGAHPRAAGGEAACGAGLERVSALLLVRARHEGRDRPAGCTGPTHAAELWRVGRRRRRVRTPLCRQRRLGRAEPICEQEAVEEQPRWRLADPIAYETHTRRHAHKIGGNADEMDALIRS
ncbi:hypothetical protein L1887_42105 [Cichorium endivia]|nr:hypothetical protein L1887_42105 [Cichorium endivia]